MENYIPRYRTINDALKIIKNFDPKTELNWMLIQRLIKKKILTQIKLGDAWLLNIDELFRLFTKENKS